MAISLAIVGWSVRSPSGPATSSAVSAVPDFGAEN
jgi:hypothetical protein